MMRTLLAETMRLAEERKATNKKALAFCVAMVVPLFGLLVTSPALTATSFVVNSTGDQADASLQDGRCGTGVVPKGGPEQCTLRAAIQQANASTGADIIDFNIGGSGVKTISPASELPAIEKPLTINGYSQPGASSNTLPKGNNATLLIELDGQNASPGANGLKIEASNSVVKGLAIHNFFVNVYISGPNGTANKIVGNFVGIDASGISDPAGSDCNGVTIQLASGNTIGGTSAATRNVISKNFCRGVWLGYQATNNQVLGNYIGTTKDGTGALGNGCGMCIIDAATGNFVGDEGPGASNIIAFNTDDGVEVYDSGSGFNTTGNRILSNSIHSNGGLGIDLVGSNDFQNPNDPGDTDTGPNKLQNFPVITSARASGGQTSINGKLNSTPNKTFTIQLFSNPSGQDEGKKYVGSKSVTTNAIGNVSFTFTPSQKVAVGQVVTATATDLGGNTSEFSLGKQVSQQ